MTATPLHIAIDARELCGRPTGVGRYLASLLEAWQRAGVPHRITLYAPSAPQWPGESGPSAAAARVGVRVVPGSRGTWWEQVHLPAALAADRPDVLFSPAYTAPIRTTVPVVLTIHDLSFAAHPEWFAWREGLRRRVLTRWSAARAAAIIAVSEFSRQEILARYRLPAARVQAIHSGLPTVASHEQRALGRAPAAPGAAPLVLYSGSIFNRRHVPDLVKAFAQTAARHPQASLVVAGENRTHPHESIEELVNRLGLAHRVALRAYVTDADLAELYARARVFAFLSEYEGFGFTPLEALQAAVPIVVADTRVAREIYGPAAVYVPVGDVNACAEALTRMIDDEEGRRRLLAAAPAVLGRYSWEKAAAQTMRVIEEAAGSAFLDSRGAPPPRAAVAHAPDGTCGSSVEVETPPIGASHAARPTIHGQRPTNPELTIIIVSYNAAGDLRRCLQSLYDAPPAIPHQIVVVDNASRDDSVAAARAWPGVQVIEAGGNLGFARANNLGIRQSKSELVLLLNSDTVVPPGAIDRLAADLRAHPEAAIAGPRLVDGEGRAELSFGRMMAPLDELRQKLLVRAQARQVWPAPAIVERMTRRQRFADWVSGACLLVRRQDAEAAGLLDEGYFMYAEDVDFCAAVRARGRRVLFSPAAQITHVRGRSRAAAPAATALAYRRSQIRFYEKHHPRWAPWLRWYLRVRGQMPDV